MAWTFCTSGAAIRKAGTNANSTITASGAALLDWSNEAENMICTIARIDLITAFSGMTANGKEVLQQYTSAHIAQKIMQYDPNSYTAGEYFYLINNLETQKKEVESLIKDKLYTKYLGVTTA